MALFFLIFLFECVICSVALNPTMHTDTTLTSLLLLFVNSGFVISLLSKSVAKKDEKQIVNMLIFSFALHICCMLWDVYCKDIFLLPNAEGDAIGYESVANSFAFGRRKDLVDLRDYSFWAGQIYKCIGRDPVTVQFLNIVFAMYSIVLIHKSAIILNISFQYRRLMVMLLCFLPNSIVITSIFLRESLIAFCVCMSIYCFTVWWKYNRMYMFVFSILFSFLGGCFHVGGLACAVGYLAMCIFISGPHRKLAISGKSILKYAALLFIALFILSANKETFFSKIDGDVTAENIVSKAGATDRVSDAEYSVGIEGLSPIPDLVINSPIRMFCFLAAPMPWMWRGIKDILAFFGSALFYLLALKEVLKSFKKISSSTNESEWLRNYLIVSLSVITIAMLMFGWGVSNVGTALRHREKFTCLFALVYAIAKQRQFDAWQNRHQVQKNA